MNTFEQSLLTELRGHVAARTPSPIRSTRTHRWRWAAFPATAAVALTAVVVALWGPSPAYAVDESGDDVVVTVYRLDDAEGLERALREHGVPAEVDYDPDVPAPTGTDGGTFDTGTGPEHGTEVHGATGDAPAAGSAPKIETSVTDDAFTLRLDRDAIPADQVLHLTTMGSADGLSGLRVTWQAA